MLSPFRGFMDTQGEINRMFDEVFGGLTRRGLARQPERVTPAMDVLSQDGDLVLRAELPGVKHEDVDVTLSNGVLTISGERKDEQERQGAGYHSRELRYGSFSRSMATAPRRSSTTASVVPGSLIAVSSQGSY